MRWFFALVLLLGVLTWVEAAAAQDSSQADDPSAIDEYVEEIPTGDGSGSASNGGGGRDPAGGQDARTSAGGTGSSSGASSELESEGGSDAVLLEEISSSSRYGAPQEKLGKKRAADNGKRSGDYGNGGNKLDGADTSSPDSAAGAAASALSGDRGGDRRLLGLLAVLVLTSAALGGVAAFRQRKRSRIS